MKLYLLLLVYNYTFGFLFSDRGNSYLKCVGTESTLCRLMNLDNLIKIVFALYLQKKKVKYTIAKTKKKNKKIKITKKVTKKVIALYLQEKKIKYTIAKTWPCILHFSNVKIVFCIYYNVL